VHEPRGHEPIGHELNGREPNRHELDGYERNSHELNQHGLNGPELNAHELNAHEPTSVNAELAELRAEVAWLKAERETLRWAVYHDELTGLPNRRLFSALAPSELHPSRAAAVILLDLNGFKPINDGFGHEAGDRVLRVVARRLVACTNGGLVARLGGDEFAGVLTSPHTDASTTAPWWQQAVTALSDAIAEPMNLSGHILSVGASIGVAPADDAIHVSELLHRADLAMYHAKIRGNRYSTWAVDGGGSGSTQQLEDAPTVDPDDRDSADVAPANTYRPSDPVWVYRHGAWRPGVVESASVRAVMVTYRRTPGTGTVVDTMAAECILTRATADRHLDRAIGRRDTAA
jgi:diguanylate cyclase (GGDEF)-like protein